MEVLTLLNIICACALCIIFSTLKSEKLASSIPTANFLSSPAIHSILCDLRKVFAYCLTLILFLPFFWIPIYIYRSIVISIARVTQPDFGNILSAFDTFFGEDCLFKHGPYPPKATIVNSVTLKTPIGLEELRRLFDKNVIRRAHLNGIRYPELRQFPTKFMGYIFWKHDNQFKLEDHVIEEHCKGQSLSLIHQEMTNRPFTPQKSPWEVILINGEKTLIIGRFHHSIADAKSIIKLFVECLGNQELSMTQPQQIQMEVVDKLLMPLRWIQVTANQLLQLMSSWNHPWKVKGTKREMNYRLPQLIRFSAKLSLADIKKIGKTSGGTGSSVIMSVISGCISKVKPDLGDMSSLYILPRANHPPTLGNHADCALVILPTGNSTSKRLETCHEIFKKLKTSNIGHYTRINLYMIGTLFYLFRKIIVHELSSCHMGITNIAGESKGFSIGGRDCSEFAFSVGSLSGDAGVVFCASSYKDHLQIAVISKGGILTENESETLACGMSEELEYLKRITSG